VRIVAIIQARLTSTRFPNKVMQTVGGKTLVKRVWEAAKGSQLVDKVVVAWPEGFPQLAENDVLGRFRFVAEREKAEVIVRLTADCPLLTSEIIDEAICQFNVTHASYYCNRGVQPDGFDVQVFRRHVLYDPYMTDKEHVIHAAGYATSPKFSVDTLEDLHRVRMYAR
jgi:glutamate-1-semialdehyde 2,1-aminomutase